MLLYLLLITSSFAQITMPQGQMDPAVMNQIMTGEFELPEPEDIYEMGLMPGGSNPYQAPGGAMSPTYMNNPFGLNSQKCMDNDMCTSWVTMQALIPKNGTGSGMQIPGLPSMPSAGGAGGAGAGGMSPLTGLPVGFHPEMYGLDPDSQMKDCMDEQSCMNGLMQFQAAQGGEGAGQGFNQFMMPSMWLQRPQYVLRQPQYAMPYNLRAPRYNSRASYGAQHLYGYQPVYYYPVYVRY